VLEICRLLTRDGLLPPNGVSTLKGEEQNGLANRIDVSSDSKAYELAQLYLTTLKYVSTESILSLKKLRSELNLSKHLASELMRKLCEDGCVSDFSYKFKGRLVNAERVRHVIVQLQAMIYGMTSKYDEGNSISNTIY
jgi:ribosomal protein S25